MTRAHYVASTHWDREWYEPFQGFRMRLVSLLDEVFDTFDRNPDYRSFVMDGQVIPIYDYLELRPGMRDRIESYVKDGRLILGPWYVLPDEWLVSGESIIRNLQYGMACASSFGVPSSRAGFLCDMFGHAGQLPQIFDQFGITGALVWRGTHERDHGGQLLWKAPDGTVLPAYRFGHTGYCTFAIKVRNARDTDTTFDFDATVDRMAAFTRLQKKRTPRGPILLFDGCDHTEIEPRMSEIIARVNDRLAQDDIVVIHSNLDAYLEELASARGGIGVTVEGEMRETGRDLVEIDEQWLIPGTLSSRIHLKQMNAACEDELCLWAEPFSAFAMETGCDYPSDYLRVAWKHLIENHPHDSICGCSPDQIHTDMIYRFDQSRGIASRLAVSALKSLTVAAAPRELPAGSLVIGVFNPTARDIDEPVDITIPFPADWPERFQEFFGFEEKFAFTVTGPDGGEIPWQLVAQRRDRMGFIRPRYRVPFPDPHHDIDVTMRLKIPAFGYTTLMVSPVEGPTRHFGQLTTGHRTAENDLLKLEIAANGTLSLTDKRTGVRFDDLLTFEERADIGDGWYHGIAVNDIINYSSASQADIALVADGFGKATFRVTVTMQVPKRFDFRNMTRCAETIPLKIVSDVTIRDGCDRLEVVTRVANTVLDHRLRVLMPTRLEGTNYDSDSAFDVVKRPVALVEDNASRRELDVETRPQHTWTAFGDGTAGLAVVSRGLPESAVVDTPERPIVLTLLRGFRRAVLDNDNRGGQITGDHEFCYWIVPFAGAVPAVNLSVLGQRVNEPVRTVCATSGESPTGSSMSLPQTTSFLRVGGDVIVTSVTRAEDGLAVRLFNPADSTATVSLSSPIRAVNARPVTLDGRTDIETTVVATSKGACEILVTPKRIATVLLGE